MGYYINPKDMSKEEWLRKNALVSSTDSGVLLRTLRPGHHLVCTVDNGAFTASGIAFDQGELNAFNYPDARMKVWSVVSDERLIAVCPHVKDALKSYDGDTQRPRNIVDDEGLNAATDAEAVESLK